MSQNCNWPVNDSFHKPHIGNLWPYVIDSSQWHKIYGHLSLTAVNDRNLWPNLPKSVIDCGQWQKKVSLTGCILYMVNIHWGGEKALNTLARQHVLYLIVRQCWVAEQQGKENSYQWKTWVQEYIDRGLLVNEWFQGPKAPKVILHIIWPPFLENAKVLPYKIVLAMMMMVNNWE